MRIPDRKVLLLLLSLPLVWQAGSASLAADNPAEKPVLVVFDFEAAGGVGKDKQYMGRKVAEMFRGHAFRRGGFITIEPAAFEEMLAQAGAKKISFATPPAEVAALARELFGAHIVIWGKVERVKADAYRMHVRILDRRKDATKCVLDKLYPSTLHGAMESVDQALDEFLGVRRKAKLDLSKDFSYRKRKNLVPNGDLEKGDVSPAAWERVDGLCTFWVDAPGREGKCIMMDTLVLQVQYEQWLRKFAKGASADDAPAPIRPRPPAYDSAGGGIGAHLYSDPIPIKQGMAYRVNLEYKGAKGETKVFVKGYAPFYGKEGKVEHREVYRSQINLYPELERYPGPEGKGWAHSVRVIHPSQPFILLTIRSDFDEGKTGEELRQLLTASLAAKGISPMRDLSETRNMLTSHEHLLRFKESKYAIMQMVQNLFGRAVVVWGEIHQKEDGKMEIQLRSLDVRKDAATKDWWHKRTLAPDELADESDKIANDIIINARLVTFLRVKLDAYWPPGKYYFDNISITEEPKDAE